MKATFVAPFLRRVELIEERIEDPSAFPDHLGKTGITEVAYEDTEHVRLTRDFLADPQRMLDRLFSSK